MKMRCSENTPARSLDLRFRKGNSDKNCYCFCYIYIYKKTHCLVKIILCQLLFNLGRKTRKVFNVATTSTEIPCIGRRKSDLRPPTAYWRSSHSCAMQISTHVLCADTALSEDRQKKSVIPRRHRSRR